MRSTNEVYVGKAGNVYYAWEKQWRGTNRHTIAKNTNLRKLLTQLRKEYATIKVVEAKVNG